MKEENKNAIEIIKQMIADGQIAQNVAEKYFPELKESEDERIRESLLEYLHTLPNHYTHSGVCAPEWIAWIENQVEHANFRNKIQIGDKVTRNEDGVLVNLSQLNRVAKPADKQGEQKPTDKVEPKFKVGDIITNEKIIGKVDGNENNKYHGWFGYDKDLSVHYADIPDVENWHLWTIQDAKDGDVLAYRGEQWIFIYKERKDETLIEYYALASERGLTINDVALTVLLSCIVPATKEQRDLLFQKMKEAGYEWDAINLKLNRISQRIVSAEAKEAMYDKPAWSEEDENRISRIIAIVRNSMSGKPDDISFLKSLKDRVQPQNTWKPSDAQMELLREVQQALLGKDCHNRFVNFMYELKWLREE